MSIKLRLAALVLMSGVAGAQQAKPWTFADSCYATIIGKKVTHSDACKGKPALPTISTKIDHLDIIDGGIHGQPIEPIAPMVVKAVKDWKHADPVVCFSGQHCDMNPSWWWKCEDTSRVKVRREDGIWVCIKFPDPGDPVSMTTIHPRGLHQWKRYEYATNKTVLWDWIGSRQESDGLVSNVWDSSEYVAQCNPLVDTSKLKERIFSDLEAAKKYVEEACR